MGRGRTTTGMIIGTLLVLRRMLAFPKRVTPDAPQQHPPAWYSNAMETTPAVGEQTREKLKWGMYDIVRSLLR